MVLALLVMVILGIIGFVLMWKFSRIVDTQRDWEDRV